MKLSKVVAFVASLVAIPGAVAAEYPNKIAERALNQLSICQGSREHAEIREVPRRWCPAGGILAESG